MHCFRLFRYSTLLYLLLFISVVFSNIACLNSGSALPDTSEFSSLFVQASSLSAKKDCSNFSRTSIDSLVRVLHKQNLTPGSFTAIINDSSGLAYTVGYRTPAHFVVDTVYPLIIYLHGGIGTTLTTKGEKAYDMLAPLGDSLPLFLCSPSANREAPWWSPSGLQRIMQTMRYMTIRYPIDPNRVFLAGVSDGATGCYMAANTIGSPFAGFLAISGYGGMLTQMGIPLIAANLMQRPIYNINAGQDHLYPLENVNSFLDKLEQQGVYLKRSVYLDEKHGFDYREKEFGAIAGLLRGWRKPEYSSSAAWAFLPGFPALAPGIIEWHIVDNPAKLPLVSYTLNHDTLTMRTQSMSSVIIGLPHTGNLIVRQNSSRIRTVRPLKNFFNNTVQAMRHSGFPHSNAQESFYQIDLKP